MKSKRAPALPFSPWRVLLPVGLGTSLSLFGDTSLYTVLPTHTDAAGVALLSVGVLLSANRWIRLVLNGPTGLLYERWPRRRLFVPALFVGALSTAIYGYTSGFWPLLVGRLLWGLAWAGIWVGGNTIVLDITHAGSRGKWVGIYQVSFFLGTSGGALAGGILTDVVGYHVAMAINAAATLLGAVLALVLLPETRGARLSSEEHISAASAARASRPNGSFAAAVALQAANRLVIPGIMLATFGLYLSNSFGGEIHALGRALGIATVTGIALSANGIISMVSSPLVGRVSDWAGSRWRMATGGLAIGMAGFLLFVFAPPPFTLFGIVLVALAGASNQAMTTALAGDIATAGRHSRRLGVLFTFGDLASAIGPPFAFALIPLIGVGGLYLFCAGVFGLLAGVSAQQAQRVARAAPTPAEMG